MNIDIKWVNRVKMSLTTDQGSFCHPMNYKQRKKKICVQNFLFYF